MPDTLIMVGDVSEQLRTLPAESIQCVVTSPPFWNLRDYGIDGQIGLEPTPEAYTARLVEVFRDVRRVLRNDGTLWLNLGDKSTTGDPKSRREKLPQKNLYGIPWRVAFALQADGWWLRDAIIWHKPNPMPGSQRDRCTFSYEYMFQLTKKARYYFDTIAIQEPTADSSRKRLSQNIADQAGSDRANAGAKTNGPMKAVGDQDYRTKRNVWTISTHGLKECHFATFPEKLVEPCIKAGTSEKGCCSACGAPWVRVVKRKRRATRPALNNVNDDAGMANRDPERHVTETTTMGWEQGCGCSAIVIRGDEPEDYSFCLACGHAGACGNSCDGQAQPIPCTVLDPFVGSGTTGIVAKRLGRHFIGVELNPDYAEMSRRRILLSGEAED